jgi:streptogramin lyase
MKAKRMILPTVIGLGLALGLLVSITAASDPKVHEMNLTPGGDVYEVNPDARGDLWLSDYDTSQVWQLKPSTGAYTVYQGLHSASDARMDATGNVWWTDYDGGNLGRISLGTSTVTTWTLPGANSPWGIAFDSAGQVWVTNQNVPLVYRFNPTSTQVCTYAMPDNGESNYIVSHAGGLWLGDKFNGRILKLDPVANQFTRWQLSAGAQPWGQLTVDGSGNIWWPDMRLRTLARLELAANRVTAYNLPLDVRPRMVAVSGESVWYTAYTGTSSMPISGTFGVLYPPAASGISVTVISSTQAVISSCSDLGAGISSSASISTGIATWGPGVVTPTVNSASWIAYQLPSGAIPWGIAIREGVWVADQGRDKLIWFPPYLVYLPIITTN